MANEFSIRIDGYQVREIRCKNDECRNFFGYENMRVGVLIFTCPNCNFISIFNMRYKQAAKEFMNQLEQKMMKGGEK